MDHDRLYTFLLIDPAFSKHVSAQKDIYLMSVFDRLNKCAVVDDSIKKSKMPRLHSKRIAIQDAFSKGQLPSILKKNYNMA